MKFQHGMPRPANSGRVKGVPNKQTIKIRAAIMGALDEVGGQSYLVKVAQSDPKTFCALLGRVLPHEIHAEVRAAVDTVISVATFYEAAPDEAITHVVIEPTALVAPAIEAIALDGAGEAVEAAELEDEPGEADEP